MIKNNNVNYIIHQAVYSAATLLITNAIIQAFLLECGVSESTVTAYLSIVQVVQVAVIFIFSALIDKIKKIVPLYSYSMLFQIILFAVLVFFCIFPNTPINVKLVFIFSFGILNNMIQAVFNVVALKASYFFLDMNKIGTITGNAGTVCGIVGVAFSTVLSALTVCFDYYKTMLVFFLAGIAMVVYSFVLTTRLKTHDPELPKKDQQPKKSLNLFTYKPFYLLVIPNILRGFNAGILITAMTIGYSLSITDKNSGAILTLVLQIAQIIGCFIYSKIASPAKDSKNTLLSSILLLIAMPCMLLGHNIIIFYLMYFFSNIFISFINYAIPCVVIKIVDFEYIGQYSSWRMLFHTAGIALSSAVAIDLVNLLGGVGTMILSASFQVISAAAYYLYDRYASNTMKNNKKHVRP